MRGSAPTDGVQSRPAAGGMARHDTDLEPGLVTVIVPAKNEEVSIAACLDSILTQEDVNLQVVVVNGRSNDRTLDIVRQYQLQDPRVDVIADPEVGTIPGSLNAALRMTRGEWVVRVDAHSTVPPGYVRRAVEHLRTGRWGGVGGRKDGVGRTPAGQAVAAVMASRFGVGNSIYHYGDRPQTVDHIPFGAYPTALLREVGGWDERLEANEDFELDYRLALQGYRLLFDPEMRIEWECRQRLVDLFHQYRRYGRGKARVVMLHPKSLSLRHLAPPGLVALLVSAPLLAKRSRRLAAAVVVPYFVALTVASALTARRVGGASARIRIPAAFAAMHVGWGLGFWQGLAAELRAQLRVAR
jgi:succinoglycan biosynthesis protein ExoA